MKAVILDLFGGSGGVGRCTREIIRQLAFEGVPTMLCGQSHVVDSFNGRLQATPNLYLCNLEKPKFSVKSFKIKIAARFNPPLLGLADALLAATKKEASAWKPDSNETVIVNYPQVIAPPVRAANFSIFLHDLNWRLYPGNFHDPDLTDRNCRGWVSRASKVMTNSECTREEVIERYNCAPEKVVAAPLAPFDDGRPGNFDAAGYLRSLGLQEGKFFLFPGVWGLHKGHDILTEAIAGGEGIDPVVVTCGWPAGGLADCPNALSNFRKSLAAKWEKLVAEKKLVVVGGVSEAEMRALRDGCRAYVLPSQYEGYGFPLVEAIYHDCPAIVSAISAHQEILRRYPQYKRAILFPPDSSAALAGELKRGIPERVQAAMDWQKKIESTWSWKNTVQRMLPAEHVN